MKKYIVTLLILSALTVFLPVSVVRAGSASHQTTIVGGGEAVLELPGTAFGFSIAGIIDPIIEAKDNINSFPDLYPWATFYENSSPWATPLTIQQRTNPYTSKNPESAKYCAQVIFHTPFAGTFSFYALTDTSTEVSTDIPDSRRLYQYSSTLAESYGLARKKPTDAGIFDRDKPTHVISVISVEDCRMNDFSQPKPKATTDVKQNAFFIDGCESESQCANNSLSNQTIYNGPWIWHWVEETVRNALGELETIMKQVTDKVNVPVQLVLTSKSISGSLPDAQANNGRCRSNDTADDQASSLCKQRGAWSSSFVPKQVFDKPFQPHAQEDQDVQLGSTNTPFKSLITLLVAFKNTKSAQDDTNTAGCFLTPLQNQKRTAVGDKSDNVPLLCNPTPTPPGQCPIDVIAQMPNPASCNLKNVGSYMSKSFVKALIPNDPNHFTYGDALPDGVPPLMQKVLDVAAAQYHIPASLLLGTMMEEGAFSHPGTWQWTDETVKAYSDCTNPQPMAACQTFSSNQGAVPPFGFIPNWWDLYINSGGPYNGKYFKATDPLLIKAAEYAKPNYSACNFTDAAFTAAREISEDQSHYYVDQPPINTPLPAQCGGVAISHDRTYPAQCTGWTTDRVGMMRMQYGERQCTQEVSDSVSRMVQTFTGL